MLTHILKRDGRKVTFNLEKITNAIFKAAQAVGGTDYKAAEAVAIRACELVENESNDIPTVEQIQDSVEKTLIEQGHSRTAKAYILYRADRTRARDMNTRIMKIYEDLTFKPAKENDVKRENANIDGDTAMGTMLKYGSEGAKQFYGLYVLDPVHRDAHDAGDIHIHDLDFLTLTTTCCQIDLVKLFEGGFCTGHGFLREPNDIQSYSALACIAIQSNQNDQHGGQSVPNFDYGMAKGVAKTYTKLYYKNMGKALDLLMGIEDGVEQAKAIADEIKTTHDIVPTIANDNDYLKLEAEALSKIIPANEIERLQKFCLKNAAKEIDRATYQAMEAFVHNLNTMHSRAGAQIPFSSINYGTDTSPEGRLVTKNVLLATEHGLGNGETAIFPIHIFKVKEGINFNESDPNYDLFKLACKVSAIRLFPNFSFIDAPFNLPFYTPGKPETEAAYMGCRTRVLANSHDKTRQTTFGRGNLSFTSVNLPRLGIEAHGDIDKFFESLTEKVNLMFEQLLHRFRIQAGKKVRNYPFLMGQGVWMDSEKLGPDDEIGEILKHGTLTSGFIGLAECLTALIGKHHGESKEAQELGIMIVNHMRKLADEKSAQTGLNFTLIATPAEGLSGRFVRMDKKRYGEIPGITDRDYYTNSFHIPVHFPISAFKKIDLEAPYHALTNAGHISYIELDGDPAKNLEAFEKVIRYMKEKGIGYGSINHPIDRDPVCGYNGIIDNECPKCGRNEDDGAQSFERIRRITGYLVGTLDRFNNAKQAEVKARVKHNLHEEHFTD
jgi:anaerobic ribonucleoside-triphosphate reductase